MTRPATITPTAEPAFIATMDHSLGDISFGLLISDSLSDGASENHHPRLVRARGMLSVKEDLATTIAVRYRRATTTTNLPTSIHAKIVMASVQPIDYPSD